MRKARPRRVFALVVALAAAVAVVWLVGVFRGPDRGAYLAANERVLSTLPRPRGTREINRQVLPVERTVFGEQLSHVVGYVTYVNFSAPAGLTSTDVVRFYGRHLSAWRATTWLVGRTRFGCFSRSGAVVSVQPEGMELRAGATRKTYGVAVDHDGGTCD